MGVKTISDFLPKSEYLEEVILFFMNRHDDKNNANFRIYFEKHVLFEIESILNDNSFSDEYLLLKVIFRKVPMVFKS